MSCCCSTKWICIKICKNQTEEICLAAVHQNGYALYYVKDQTEEICLAAVQRNGYTLYYVKEQTEEICLTAVKKDWRIFEYIRDNSMRKKNYQKMLAIK